MAGRPRSGRIRPRRLGNAGISVVETTIISAAFNEALLPVIVFIVCPLDGVVRIHAIPLLLQQIPVGSDCGPDSGINLSRWRATVQVLLRSEVYPPGIGVVNNRDMRRFAGFLVSNLDLPASVF